MKKIIRIIKRLSKPEYLLLILILFIALWARLYKIDNPIADWHSWRQADTASVTRFYVQNGIDLLRPRYLNISSSATGYENPKGYRFVEFPVFNAVHALLYQAFPSWSLERWGRLITAATSLISLFFIYLIGKRFLGTPVALLAALFFAVLPFNIYFSRVILPDPLTVTVALASVWFFIWWIDTERSWKLFTSAFFFATALLLKPYIVFYGIPMLYLVVTKYGVWGAVKEAKLWMFFCLSLIPVFFWRAWMGYDYYFVGIPFWEWAFNGDEIRFKPSFWWWIFGQRLGQLILGGWALVPFVIGLLSPSRGKFPWFVHSMLAGQLLYIAVVATANVRHDYYQTLLIPAIVFPLANGTYLLWRLRAFNQLLTRVAVLGVLAAGLAFSFYQIKEFYKVNHPEIIIAGAAADRLIPKDAKIIAPYNGDTAFLYQTKRQGWPFVTLPMDQMISRLGAQYYVAIPAQQNPTKFDKQTEEIMEKYQVVEKTDQYVVVKLQ